MIPTLDKLDIDSKLIAIMIVLEALFEEKKLYPQRWIIICGKLQIWLTRRKCILAADARIPSVPMSLLNPMEISTIQTMLCLVMPFWDLLQSYIDTIP